MKNNMRRFGIFKKFLLTLSLIATFLLFVTGNIFCKNSKNVDTLNQQTNSLTEVEEKWEYVENAPASIIGGDTGTFNFKYNLDTMEAIIYYDNACYSSDFTANELNFNDGYFDYVYPQTSKLVHLKLIQIGEVHEHAPTLHNTFAGCLGIKKVIIPETVKIIGEGCFENCFEILSVDLSKAIYLERIDNYAFQSCVKNTHKVYISNTVTKVGKKVFYDNKIPLQENNVLYSESDMGFRRWCLGTCDLSKEPTADGLTIMDSTYAIAPYAFEGCRNIKGDLTIYDTVQEIGEYAFKDTGLSVNETGVCTSVAGGHYKRWCLGIIDSTLASTQTGVVKIPAETYYIAPYAFASCVNVTGFSSDGQMIENRINIPRSTVRIGEYAFYNCKKIVSSDDENGELSFGQNSSLTTICDSAFALCPIRGDMTIPSTITYFGKNAFTEINKTTNVPGARLNRIFFENTDPDSITFGENWNGVSTLRIMSDTSSTIHVPVGTKGTSYPHVGYMGRPNFGFQFYSVIEGIPTKKFEWDFERTNFQPGQTIDVTLTVDEEASPIPSEDIIWTVNYSEPGPDNYASVEEIDPLLHKYRITFNMVSSQPKPIQVRIKNYPASPLIRTVVITSPVVADELSFKENKYDFMEFKTVNLTVGEKFFTRNLSENVYDSNNIQVTTGLKFSLVSVSGSFPDFLIIDENTGIISGKFEDLQKTGMVSIRVEANGLSGQSTPFCFVPKIPSDSWTRKLEYILIGATGGIILLGTLIALIITKMHHNKVRRNILKNIDVQQIEKPKATRKPKKKEPYDPHKIWK